MNRIKQLTAAEAQKIAAGEVVERPANVVKELLENALDAQASQISIYIKDGGKELIRIVDNGHGMSADDARMCFLNHATSKISSVDDLQTIATFGFRGEALSSICAVSNITLITRQAEDAAATKLTLEQTVITAQEPVAAPVGTDIAIHNLFYNVPARKKFLKTTQTEWRAILTLFQAMCLDYQKIHFKLYHEDALVLQCPPVNSVLERIGQLYDDTQLGHMIALESTTSGGITLEGAISNHQYGKYDRGSIFFFVNGRWIKNHKLTSALLKGYLNVLPAGRYPAGCLFITLAPTLVDINIHPRKEEVQFLNPRLVEQLISSSVKRALENHLSSQLKKEVSFAPVSFIPEAPFAAASALPPFQFARPMHASTMQSTTWHDQAPFADEQKQSVSNAINEAFAQAMPQPAPAIDEKNLFTSDDATNNNYELIGQYNKTYILLEKEDGLYFIDQHAAHERILYEQFANRFEEVAIIPLLFPLMVHVAKQDIAMLEPYMHIIKDNGIAIEVFGDDQCIITATPVHLKNCNMQELIGQVVGWIHEAKYLAAEQFTKTIHEKLRAQMACKAAIKAGDALDTSSMHQLIADLEKTANRFTCPHGRPTGWSLSLYEIEKKFKRKL